MKPRQKCPSLNLISLAALLLLAIRLHAKRMDRTCLDFSEQIVGDGQYKYEYV